MSAILSPLLYEKRARVATLTINRPDVMNAMDSHAHLALSEALDEAQHDPEVRVVVLTGCGDRAFSAGRDLRELARQADLNPEEKAALDQRWARTRRLTDRQDFFKPIIARVNGVALGGGFELALACDLIVAADHATFALPEPKRGLIATAGGVHRLPRQLPLKIAMGLLLTGDLITAPRAAELGLVNECVPAAELNLAVTRYVDRLLACAPLSVQATKQCAMNGLGRTLQEALTAHYPLEALRQSSEDALEGPRAFAEKRTPHWKGC
ncbi:MULTISPECIES: enoyl-CoA hydratase-related protein [Burkholderia cepacia complex]|uniref:enoyl-CoA hydratase-related protein n=1 Tax=Burkholderia cepacia complex TaxID=87882 RepID=UPI000052DFE0|nr:MULTISPECIES: enoyl-CoA hydratase-related protein [Burkholderia cepacia complex]ABK06931.1 short chain enoyl-CoA hydratase [Burkholderia cenocepacia HI2424]MBJ9727713.1 enoyl-CoA hydratase/isomerase family protein [Burkholderia cenocepacia]MCA8334067.1 enoyl-CoA hydratase/isomerase family protein [Burkholderia cepacia]MDN7914171.1 enoyl-CoA hydratase-related protein [Burkholderia cepacia]MDR5663684.1 enoyl-CoA hydratase/isomerase family protein [Burkholderia cenocepacia]